MSACGAGPAGAVYAVIVAAGSGTRMGAGINKVLLDLRGESVLRHAVRPFLTSREIAGVCVVCKPSEQDRIRQALQGDADRVTLVSGGETRQESVLAGLRALPADAEFVLVHDGARPLVTERIVADCIAALRAEGSAVACTRVSDTIKRAEGGMVQGTVPRDGLRAVQTPQGFRVADLRRAMEAAQAENARITDEASAMERLGLPVRLVECGDVNLKITTATDMVLAEAVLRARSAQERADPAPRVGLGYDVHRLVPGRKLILGGVEVPFEKGLDGHSDADVLVHAVMDAMLGAAALGDIGKLFPDNDDAYLGADSMELLKKVRDVLRAHGWKIGNLDATVIAQRPKLAPYIDTMRSNIADALETDVSNVSVKATTEERLGFTGSGEGIAAHAVCLIQRV